MNHARQVEKIPAVELRGHICWFIISASHFRSEVYWQVFSDKILCQYYEWPRI